MKSFFKKVNLKKLVYWVLGTYIVCLLITLVMLWWYGASLENTKEVLPYAAEYLVSNLTGWTVLLLPYCIYKLSRFLHLSWKHQPRRVFVKHFSFTIAVPLALLFTGFSFSKWYTQSESYNYEWDHSFDNTQDTVLNRYANDGKQRGMHVFGWDFKPDDTLAQTLVKTNTEWLTLVPWGDQKDYDSEQIGHAIQDYPNMSKRDSSYVDKIKEFKSKGFYIMLKPHIWIYNASAGKWRSDIMPPTENGWKTWSASYKKFILHYARISELSDADLFCIGTELHQTIKNKPDFWRQLIQEVRSVYSGKITYAANWNQEIADVSFWDQLDYIGIQAYFPLTQKTEPNVFELKKGWKKHLNEIEALSTKYNKPVLFTEIGYKSTADSAIEPWVWPEGFSSLYKKVSFKTQANCYEAFFQTFWDKDWFAGVHFWQWQARKRRHKNKKDITFTPQTKPAENIMTKWFATPAK